jgi:hypothetical protein
MLEPQIRKNLWNYLLGKSSLDEFKEWFIPASWDVEKSDDEKLIELVSQIKLRLAEYSSEAWSEPELKGQLIQLLVNPVKMPRVQFYDGISSVMQQAPAAPTSNEELSGKNKVENPLMEIEYSHV